MFAIYQILLGRKAYEYYVKPTNSPTQGQPNPRKIRLKAAFEPTFSHSRIFLFVGWDRCNTGNGLQETQPNQIPILRLFFCTLPVVEKTLYFSLHLLPCSRCTTAVPFWDKVSPIPSNCPPKRECECGSERVELVSTGMTDVLILVHFPSQIELNPGTTFCPSSKFHIYTV